MGKPPQGAGFLYNICMKRGTRMEDKEKKQGLRLLHSLPEEEPDI